MGDDKWWDSFDSVIRRWLHTDERSIAAWERYSQTGSLQVLQQMANRGCVAPDDPPRVAAWEAFLYQRSHIEAFKAVVL